MSEWSFSPVGGYGAVITLAVLLVIVLMMLGLPRDCATPRRRGILTGLRVFVLLLLIAALLRPALVYTQTKKEKSTLVLLADASRSMQITDAFGGKSRWGALRTTLEDAASTIKGFGDEVEVKAYTFDTQLHPADIEAGEVQLDKKPEGDQTALGSALEDVLRREANKRLAGVVVLSDGAQRALSPRDLAPQTPARRLADLGYPLYAVTFGQARGASQSRDVALQDLLVNQTVFVKNELSVSGTTRIDGFASQDIPLQLLFETRGGQMEVVATKPLRSESEGQSLPITLGHVPQLPGEYKVTLLAPKQPGELVTTNNHMSTFVTVLEGGLNVLYLEGKPRVDAAFIGRALDASPDIRTEFITISERNPADREVNLRSRFEPGKFDVYIIGDIDSSAFSREELILLATAVQNGAGLIMLGGYHTFGPGGYARTPLAGLLPIEMQAIERQGLDEPIRADVHLPGPIQMLPARPLGVRHFVMSLAADADNQTAWEKLPVLDGANRLGAVKRSAQVLAETQAGQPLLVAQEAGGRVMAFAADSTWHWQLQGFETAHKRFWRQVILWLAHQDQLGKGAVWIKLPQRRFGPASRVEFTAGAKDPQGQVIEGATFEVEVVQPDGTRQKVSTTPQGEYVLGTFAGTQQAGDYTVVVTAMRAGENLGTSQARFLVFEQDLELDNAAADPTLLASLARMTESVGGRVLAPEELPDLLKSLKDQPQEVVEREVRLTPYDTWPFFLAFVGVLSVEWFLRKKWGLV